MNNTILFNNMTATSLLKQLLHGLEPLVYYPAEYTWDTEKNQDGGYYIFENEDNTEYRLILVAYVFKNTPKIIGDSGWKSLHDIMNDYMLVDKKAFTN